ncbi:divalent-cation tolerance protein CutA [Methanosarcina sp. KYL-1]|uniref:divalent-cation tolerance protein CutA n=1 Tax=Methanosarcina sp. KYL-1 TaxID=2602068 RepID=UPI0021015129|nr:divalent-cation tolerance protein CutA [Methanosarcina sp. KYL-1]MCQ1536837.1 divalent-cation tolerance protein CutA [Methanosarcina sp. KYL-1]
MLGIVYITAGDMKNASEIARELVSKRLAACVNMFPISSVYMWEGKIEEGNEIAMIVKTDISRFEEICKVVKALHTYELPAIEFWEIEGEPEYLDWVQVNSSGEEAP